MIFNMEYNITKPIAPAMPKPLKIISKPFVQDFKALCTKAHRLKVSG